MCFMLKQVVSCCGGMRLVPFKCERAQKMQNMYGNCREISSAQVKQTRKKGEEHCSMCSQLEIFHAYGCVFSMERDERYVSYGFSRERDGRSSSEASGEWKQMHGTAFHCVEVVFSTVTATKWVERLTGEGVFFPPPKGPTWTSIIWSGHRKRGSLEKEEGWERNPTWRNFAAHFHDFFFTTVCNIRHLQCEGTWMKTQCEWDGNNQGTWANMQGMQFWETPTWCWELFSPEVVFLVVGTVKCWAPPRTTSYQDRLDHHFVIGVAQNHRCT